MVVQATLSSTKQEHTMSSSFQDSLSALANMATDVEALLAFGDDINKTQFYELKELINKLQVACPNHDAVNTARVRWYTIALDNFETHFVLPAEDGRLRPDLPIWEYDDTIFFGERIPGLLVGIELLTYFLRRHYLKREFPKLFTRLLSLFDRVIETQLPFVIRSQFECMANRMREDLLKGRL